MEWSFSPRRWLGAALTALLATSIGCGGGSSSTPTGTSDFGASFLVTDVRVDTDAAAGDAKDVEICNNGSTIYAAYEDTRNGSADIFINKSTDGGDTWEAADRRLNTNVAGASVSHDVSIACSGSYVYVVWEDDRNGSSDIYYQRSTDGGATWLLADVRLDQDVAGAAQSGDPQVVAEGTRVHIVWEDDRTGSRDVLVRSSTDYGATFAAEVSARTGVTGAADRPRIAMAGSNVYVVWHDNRNGLQDVYLNGSMDSGATWGVSDIRLDTDVAGAGTSFDPAIDCMGQSVYVAWADTRNGESDIYFNTSADGGATFLATDVRMDTDVAGATFSFRPQITCTAGDKVYVGWIDNRTAERDVFINASTDGGATWLASDIRLDTDTAGAARSDWVRLVATGTNVYAVWQDNRNGEYDVRFNFSTDNGTTWQAADQRTDTTVAGASESLKPKLAHRGNDVYVVWTDSRSGDGNIHCNSCQTR